MKILYGYSNCSDTLYGKLTSENNAAVLRQAQKYHSLLIRGLAAHVDTVACISGLPINRQLTGRVLVREKDEAEGNIRYHYLTTLNVPGLRQLMVFFGTFRSVFKSDRRDARAICDCLSIATAWGMALACKLKRIPLLMIVTDLPDMRRGNKLLRAINNALLTKADGFIFLTAQMNERVNKKHKPFLVLEGHADSRIGSLPPSEKYERTEGKKVVVYAGSLQRLYGIQNLVEGFLAAALPDAELWIYGSGDYSEELERICRDCARVKYLGVRDNGEIVDAERKASLLVNPRPVAPEYTKYSFPSKNMEYMASGTPVLTTVLPGMPEEYYPFVYLLEDESSEGIAEKLRTILGEDESVRNAKGAAARRFVLTQKSNTIQAGKIVLFLKREFS